jgi:putative MFS transporter
MLTFTMALTGLSSLWTGLVHDYNSFIAARGVTGIGIGADLAIVNAYVGELALTGTPKEEWWSATQSPR